MTTDESRQMELVDLLNVVKSNEREARRLAIVLEGERNGAAFTAEGEAHAYGKVAGMIENLIVTSTAAN